ncbi:(deoxy)nucleoside triphosphate pyrophosphohydrolase [Clostridium sp. NSJ-6]|uniref:8-oxo-dGTP diphosphatase n=1 Tax=Clostridium hominis TaxID=2763036 RepID=A0ABR7DAN5_9CLOT|nr:(deoxy)nucleoside triphosphate pyrophosphohydrolase [Clostridium hominis]MBC5628205.1 (deoxy)nucleoside triphosphate pyrophosphohydrolase [Clostridium hominis]MDU2671379.1 (deoxy)nucleoside triphosphate pyrophosphohydrolase [Clostridium sp.]
MIKVVAAILEKENKILIAKKREGKPLAGLWEFPGGKIEEGETPEESLIRELMEEMNIKVRVNEYVGESIYDYGDGKVISLKGFTAEIIEGDIKLTDHDEYKWVTLEEICNYRIAPADIPLISNI